MLTFTYLFITGNIILKIVLDSQKVSKLLLIVMLVLVIF
jgi:hypothetical protein